MEVKTVTRQVRRLLPLGYCGAVIVAAGTASRMGGIDKVMAPLAGEPVILHTVRAFDECESIREIVVVTRDELILPITDLCKDMKKVKAVVVGGADRTASVQAGLNALSSKVKLAAIHDGARPLVSYDVIDRTVRAAHNYRAAAPAVAVKDTIKIVKGGVVVSTPDRATLRGVQTPQVFDFDLLRGALKKVSQDKVAVTDDCSAVEYMGMSVKIVEGEEKNIKITTPMDLKLAEMLMEETK